MSLQDLRLFGKVALVTGAGRGIGRATALALAACGVKVVCADLPSQHAAAEDTAAACITAGAPAAMATDTDATAADQLEGAVAAAVLAYGGLDISVAVVGGLLNLREALLDLTDDGYHMNIGLTQHSQVYQARAAARQMVKQGRGGKIVMIGSIMCEFSAKTTASYTMAKSAVKQLCRVAANELGGHGINVNCVQPGYIDTPGERVVASEQKMNDFSKRIPLQRMGEPKDIANLVAFLCSGAAEYITGAAINCDGGYLSALSL